MTSSNHHDGRERRLKSLDEFEPLPWHRQRRRAIGGYLLLAIGIVVGGAIGWLLAV